MKELKLTTEDIKSFMEALENPPKPNKYLIQLMNNGKPLIQNLQDKDNDG